MQQLLEPARVFGNDGGGGRRHAGGPTRSQRGGRGRDGRATGGHGTGVVVDPAPPGEDLQGLCRPDRRRLPHPSHRGARQVRQVLRRPGEEARRREVRRRRHGPAGQGGRGGGEAQGRRRPADHPPLRPRRRRAGAEQAHRRGPAHGAVLAALQRPRLDVLPAVAQAGQEGRAPAHQRLGRDRAGGRPAARAGLDEADADPRRRRAARHGRRLLGRAGQEEARRGAGDRSPTSGSWRP